MAITTVLDDVLELADLLKPAWAHISDGIPEWHPRCEDPDPDPDPSPDPDPDPDPDPQPDPDPKPEDWKAHSRKHERDAKRLRKELDERDRKLAEFEEANKTEQEKAVEQAKKEAADAAKAEVASGYRQKILKAEIRAQAAGKFANPNLAVKLLDLDEDAIFDDEGEIDEAAIAAAIDEFLEDEANEGLKATPNGGRLTGSGDGGRGRGDRGVEDMSPDDHLKAIQRHKQ